MTSVADWDDRYARVARICSQQRSVATTPPSDKRALQQQLEQLQAALDPLRTYLTPAEFQRRSTLVQHLLQQQQQQPNNQNPSLSTTQEALSTQDAMIDELSKGVGRLKDQSILVKDEANLHVNLLGDMERNVESAQYSLEEETRRAQLLRESQSVWRLQLIVAGLTILLFLLLLMGLS